MGLDGLSEDVNGLLIEPSHCAKQPHGDAVTVGFFLFPGRAVGPRTPAKVAASP